jgi:putative membrane protein
MIPSYSDHAANERTFLAWIRTGVAVIAFGFVVEKLNRFVLTMAIANPSDVGRRVHLEGLLGPFGHYDGLALILVGTALVVLVATRFVRTERMLDDQQLHSARNVRAELLLSAALALLVAAFGICLVLA